MREACIDIRDHMNEIDYNKLPQLILEIKSELLALNKHYNTYETNNAILKAIKFSYTSLNHKISIASWTELYPDDKPKDFVIAQCFLEKLQNQLSSFDSGSISNFMLNIPENIINKITDILTQEQFFRETGNHSNGFNLI